MSEQERKETEDQTEGQMEDLDVPEEQGEDVKGGVAPPEDWGGDGGGGI